ncbi:MAG: hypothetical protein ACLSAH_09245 [Bilophila wadsworthia]
MDAVTLAAWTHGCSSPAEHNSIFMLIIPFLVARNVKLIAERRRKVFGA